jgi:sucrose-6-phosphate hydrolase SacC (GH32 family)
MAFSGGGFVDVNNSSGLGKETLFIAFTDPDRSPVFECPEIFELPIVGKPGESRWILLGAQNRYFIGQFDGQTFRKESGPHGTQHGAFYAAQTFSGIPDRRCIQIGWVRTALYTDLSPDQVVSQSFTLPHTLTLHETSDGLRVHFWPVQGTEVLREETMIEGRELSLAQANEMLQQAESELSEVLIATDEKIRSLKLIRLKSIWLKP